MNPPGVAVWFLSIYIIIGLKRQIPLGKGIICLAVRGGTVSKGKSGRDLCPDSCGYIGLKATRASGILEPILENSRIPEITSKKL
jgi:hypothetical protein